MLPVSKLGKIIRIPAFVQLKAKTDIYTYRYTYSLPQTLFSWILSAVFTSLCYMMWSRDAILSLRLAGRKLNFEVRETVKRLRCLRRGCRAGRRVQQRTRTACRTVIETATAGGIPVISTNRHLLTNSPPFPASFRDRTSSVLRTINRQQSTPLKLGVFNARSMSTYGKSQAIASWVTDLNLSVVGLVET